jgi:hypothetical protein
MMTRLGAGGEQIAIGESYQILPPPSFVGQRIISLLTLTECIVIVENGKLKWDAHKLTTEQIERLMLVDKGEDESEN